MKQSLYVLEGKTPVPLVDLSDSEMARWGRFMEDKDLRRVAITELENGLRISTVFLAVDHGWGDKPILFETMVFGGEDDFQRRYSTWQEAEAGHQQLVEQLS